LALWINPFNNDARINTLIDALGNNDSSQLGELEKIAESGIRLAPQDARGYSVLGEIKQRQGYPDEAQKLYAEALAIAPTEIHALINRLNEAGRTGEFEVALEAMDIILRRWSRYAKDVLPAVDYFIGQPEGAVWFRSTLANEPPWRGTIISHLISSPAGIDFVQNLLLDEATKGKRQNQTELSRTITTLLRGGATDQAYRLFQLTLNDDERQVRGYVFDSNFTLTPSGKPFDWAIAKTTDADVEFAKLALAEDEQGLRVSFRNSPAKLGSISQLLKLGPGQYRLLATATARNLDAPKGLKWMIVCQAPRAISLTQLEVLEKTYRLKELSTDFTVPPEGCPFQLLVLRTGVKTSSWRARYNGTVTFKSIRITADH
jgi:tetratricopeptide (TPR) repeat protein